MYSMAVIIWRCQSDVIKKKKKADIVIRKLSLLIIVFSFPTLGTRGRAYFK